PQPRRAGDRRGGRGRPRDGRVAAARRMKIYTRTGDRGETSLLGGARVAKDHLRVAAYGDIDELNALIGVARAQAVPARAVAALLGHVQRDLLAIGAQLADPTSRVVARRRKAALGAGRIRRLERAIDAREARLPALTRFILPGGTPLAAFLHLARTVCRRSE